MASARTDLSWLALLKETRTYPAVSSSTDLRWRTLRATSMGEADLLSIVAVAVVLGVINKSELTVMRSWHLIFVSGFPKNWFRSSITDNLHLNLSEGNSVLLQQHLSRCVVHKRQATTSVRDSRSTVKPLSTHLSLAMSAPQAAADVNDGDTFVHQVAIEVRSWRALLIASAH